MSNLSLFPKADSGPVELSQVLQMSSRVEVLDDSADKERKYYHRHPAKYCHDKLGFELKGIQPQVMQSVADGHDTAVRTGHKCGEVPARGGYPDLVAGHRP